jgi:hypothetical protein
MVAIWVLVGLIVSAISVSSLGAAFSIFGLRDLFAGASIAVAAMAGSLELAKFVLAAYLHQRWSHLNVLFKTYLSAAIVTLSLITSMGIFGFLSKAYQSASSVLEAETIKFETLKARQVHNDAEMARITKAIDEIPANRVTKKMQARAEAAPEINQLEQEARTIAQQLADANLHIVDVKQKVGPLIYVSRAFKMNIDDVVKYLILVLVCVFDPLAICLVIATSEAIETRKKALLAPKISPLIAQVDANGSAVAPAAPLAASSTPAAVSDPVANPAAETHGGDEIIKMSFVEEPLSSESQETSQEAG